MKRSVQWGDQMAQLYPELFTKDKKGNRELTRTVTFQVTDDCNLRCTYCYQINKGKRVMSFDTAKKMVDELLKGNAYVNADISPFIIIEFIGGEPFLEVELMDQITENFKQQLLQQKHHWAGRYMISISSNGTLYFEPKVQEYLNKNKGHLSMSITIDGNKKLHDSCRVFPDGSGSYDKAIAAVKDWVSKGNYMGSKITIAPENLPYLYEAIVEFIEFGYTEIHANTVYEKGWTIEHATEFYHQMKRIADYMIEQNLSDKVELSLFDDLNFKPMSEEDNQNWCGGTGYMLSCDPDGYYYPCIRYMESSLGDDQKPIRIGHVDTGIMTTEEERKIVDCLNCVTRRSQSTDECFNCPIAQGCAWCSAYNYQEFGTVDKRATYICEMHKARSLANVYYWNKVGKPMQMHCPEEWAVPIIGEEEYNMLKEVSEYATEDR